MPIRAEWETFAAQLYRDAGLGVTLDLSRMGIPGDFLPAMQGKLQNAFAAMEQLEAGSVANADENRMVGHYWLRASHRAPPAIRPQIEAARRDVSAFARDAAIRSAFDRFLLIGIGGSMLGPQFMVDALGAEPGRALAAHFVDNTDPVGVERTLAALAGKLDRTLVVVSSKSGDTPETRNGMFEVQRAYARANVPFAPRAVAVTQEKSTLDRTAAAEGWRRRFPIWDWVGGRTSVCSAVGLLPLALAGGDVEAFLAGAARMDEATRKPQARQNPAALLALAWHYAGNGRGDRAMVVLPYCDRMALFGKYLQQLVMESLGKERDRAGEVVRQGLTVYGNKGSTDQHSYIQQLRDGPDDYFATFVAVLEAQPRTEVVEVEPGVTSDDYLHAFLLGTRAALAEKDHPSMLLTLERADAASVGAAIALFERAVGLYAELVNVNAYHQPGVQAGKDSANGVLKLQRRAMEVLRRTRGRGWSARDIAEELQATGETETVFRILHRLATNPMRGVRCVDPSAPLPEWKFRID